MLHHNESERDVEEQGRESERLLQLVLISRKEFHLLLHPVLLLPTGKTTTPKTLTYSVIWKIVLSFFSFELHLILHGFHGCVSQKSPLVYSLFV